MKNKLITICMATFIALQLHAQNTIPTGNIPPKTSFTPPTATAKLTVVTEVSLVQDSVTTTTHPGAANTYVFHFKGIIKSTGAGTVTYNWLSVNPNHPGATPSAKAGSITLSGTGTDVVLIDEGTPRGGFVKLALQTVTPNQVTSNSITY